MVALAVLSTSPGSLAEGPWPGGRIVFDCEMRFVQVLQALVPVDLVVESLKLTTQEDELLRFGREARTAALCCSRHAS